MIYNEVKFNGDVIKLCAEENAKIQVVVNGKESILLPLEYDGRLTVRPTRAGLAAIEQHLDLENPYTIKVKEVEFEGNDHY